MPDYQIAAIAEITLARQGIKNAEINVKIDDAISAINNVWTKKKVDEIKATILTIIGFVQTGRAEGIEEGKIAGKAEALGEMGEPCTDCTAVEVKKGDKIVTLYAPDKVSYIKK